MTHSTTWNLVKQQGLLHRWGPWKQEPSDQNYFVTWRGWGSSSVQNPIIKCLWWFFTLEMMMVVSLELMKMTFHSVPLKYSLAQFESIYCNKLLVCCCQTHFHHETIIMRMKVTIVMMMMMILMLMMTGMMVMVKKSHPICLLIWQCAHCSEYSNVCHVTKT